MADTTFDAKEAARALYARHGNWRAVAAALGGNYSPAYWCAVARGTMKSSRRAENVLRRWFGLAPRGVTRVADMPAADLAWYLANRREVCCGG